MRASGGTHNHTHLMSGRTARKTSCAFAACVVACVLPTVVCLFCVAVGCAACFFVDYVMVCILHAVLFPLPFCSLFWPEFGYLRYVCNSMPSGSVLFCVVLFCVLCNVLFCIFAVFSVVLGVDTSWACCSLCSAILLWYAAC